MGRRRIKRKPLTSAERVRRHRDAKKRGVNLRGPGIEQAAKEAGIALSTWFAIQAIEHHGISELSALVGQVGVNLLADLARHTRKNVQRRFVATLKAEGAKAAREYAMKRIAVRKGK